MVCTEIPLSDGRKIFWAPECETPAVLQNTVIISATELCDFKYHVPHYSPQASGRAFGPLSLDQTHVFCSALDSQLAAHMSIVLTTPRYDEPARSNAAVLLGAYLALLWKWSAEGIEKVIGTAEGKRGFPCSWARSDRPEPIRILKVSDCWAGLAHAMRLGWINPKYNSIDTIQTMVHQYDAAWIVPGRILVCADPVSTLDDPAPYTFSYLYPEEIKEQSEQANRKGTGTPSTDADDCMERVQSPALSEDWENCSCDTVDKDYAEALRWDPGCTIRQVLHSTPTDFVSFLRLCGVGLVLRGNFQSEPGLPRSYDSSRLVAHGFQHADIPIVDQCGGLPSEVDFARIRELSKTFEKANMFEGANAIALHCKGGFGRSVTLACHLVMMEYDIPGRALLGWIRIARPGAITSVSQEKIVIAGVGASKGKQDVGCCILQ